MWVEIFMEWLQVQEMKAEKNSRSSGYPESRRRRELRRLTPI